MVKLKLNFDDMQNQIFSVKPFQKPFSRELFMAVKLENYDLAREYLLKNKYLVYDYDYMSLTPLH